jgi:hypothetical protein
MSLVLLFSENATISNLFLFYDPMPRKWRYYLFGLILIDIAISLTYEFIIRSLIESYFLKVKYYI